MKTTEKRDARHRFVTLAHDGLSEIQETIKREEMKREQLKHESPDDRKRRTLIRELLARRSNPPPKTAAWFCSLPDEDKILLLTALQSALFEMAASAANMSASIIPILGAMIVGINVGDEEKDNANDT